MGPGVGHWENKGWEGYGRHKERVASWSTKELELGEIGEN